VAFATLGPLPHVLLALCVVILTARGLGLLFRRIGQPAVVGEMVAGILLGPSLLGRIAPGVSEFVLPPATAPHVGMIANVGVVLFMFLVGLELDAGLVLRRARPSLAVALTGIAVPFALGVLLAVPLYAVGAPAQVPLLHFALFLGVSMSVTAFPVLARILHERGMQQTPVGTMALACAAVADVTAWCLLALVVGVAKGSPGEALQTVGLTLAFVLVMLVAVRPYVVRWAARQDEAASQGTMAVAFIGLLLSALATEWIGIHALFGAFLFGAMIPHDSALSRSVTSKLTDVVVVMFLPAFFAFTGMRTELGLVSGLDDWLWCAAIIAVAVAGKFGGSCAAARLTGMPWRESAALGVLMNTRGLMELVVLNIGLDLGVISRTVFAMLVAMALLTTLMTSPVLARLLPAAR
jgi:K+:H+ antiporter